MVNNTPQRQVHGNMLSPNVLMNKLQPSSTGRVVWQAAEYMPQSIKPGSGHEHASERQSRDARPVRALRSLAGGLRIWRNGQQ